jgi:cyclophilin family peptidyl-prolyl cis-trans isomerase
MALLATASVAVAAEPARPRSMPQVLEASKPEDWRPLDPENTVYLELASGRVVIELSPTFAPNHVANVKALAREGFFDGLTINRVQDNYVTQWGDPDSDDATIARAVKTGKRTLAAEFKRPSAGVPFTRLRDGDVYAPEAGFSAGMPAARDQKQGTAWLAHCYGMVGAARENGADTGSGRELYVVIGHGPRHLDRNVTLLGRVVRGMDLLSPLPRGTGPLGVYEKAEQRIAVRGMRVAADVPAAERTSLEVLRTDTPTFEALVESRRNRPEDWFKQPAGHIELCNVPLPVRPAR